jgi:hypothetical protein
VGPARLPYVDPYAGRRTWSSIPQRGRSTAVLMVVLRPGYLQGCRRQGEVAQNVGCLVFQREEL